eukprot:659358-Pelagomonas_calceolata.AAC.1
MGEVKEHAFGETLGRMHNQGPVCCEGLELQSFSYHPAFFSKEVLVARPVFFLCLPCFSRSELRGGWVGHTIYAPMWPPFLN